MNLTKLVLPEAVLVSGSYFKIHTGHPYWFRFAKILEQDKMYLVDFDHLYVDDKPTDKQAGVDALAAFFWEKKEVPRAEEGEECEQTLDYELDADLLYSAFLQCYGIDLYEKEIHWHKVRAMIAGLIGTRLNEVMSYRLYNGNDKELKKMKRIWSLPVKMSDADKAELEAFEAQFK